MMITMHAEDKGGASAFLIVTIGSHRNGREHHQYQWDPMECLYL